MDSSARIDLFESGKVDMQVNIGDKINKVLYKLSSFKADFRIIIILLIS
ncbi:hypothetical protein AP058_02250 [Flavobacterium sp. TAB 87]|nr:hypothetical protein AP058_02250 [Flavobacterium sp. TAB 87]